MVFKREFLSNAIFLIKWLALAYVLEALLVNYVPASAIATLVGGEGIVPIATAALVGMPAYLNSYVAPPLLDGLIEPGMSNGAAMAFMVSGAATSGHEGHRVDEASVAPVQGDGDRGRGPRCPRLPLNSRARRAVVADGPRRLRARFAVGGCGRPLSGDSGAQLTGHRSEEEAQ